MTYIGEFKAYWRYLLAATMGLALGSALNHYMTNIFGPSLIAEFGWKRSQFALIGSLAIFVMPLVPVLGRLTDRFGARAAATVGFIAVPASFFAYSFMSGSIVEFFAISLFQHSLGILTTTLVFSRVVIERFDVARGMALSICMSGAPLVGAISVPIIGAIVDEEGWRMGYRAMGFLSAAGGLGAVLLMGRQKVAGKARDATEGKPAASPLTRADIRAIVRNPAFALLIGGMLFCNLPQVIVSSQLKLVLLESGSPSQLATWIVSLYAMGVVVGRFASGLALDRVPPHIVSIVALGLPAVGFVILASHLDAAWLLACAVLLIGLAQGAEGDVGAYITSRKFSMKHFSFIYSFLIAAIGLSAALGSLILSYSLHVTDSFNAFLVVSAVVTVFGAIAFYLTGRVPNAVTLNGEQA